MFTLKRISFLSLLLFICSYGWTINTWENNGDDRAYIALKWGKNNETKNNTQKRAPRQIPCVLYDGVEITFVSSSLMQAQYAIVSSNVIVEEGVLELIPKKETPISVASFQSGDYELQLTIGSDVYVGNFTIEE